MEEKVGRCEDVDMDGGAERGKLLRMELGVGREERVGMKKEYEGSKGKYRSTIGEEEGTRMKTGSCEREGVRMERKMAMEGEEAMEG